MSSMHQKENCHLTAEKITSATFGRVAEALGKTNDIHVNPDIQRWDVNAISFCMPCQFKHGSICNLCLKQNVLWLCREIRSIRLCKVSDTSLVCYRVKFTAAYAKVHCSGTIWSKQNWCRSIRVCEFCSFLSFVLNRLEVLAHRFGTEWSETNRFCISVDVFDMVSCNVFAAMMFASN